MIVLIAGASHTGKTNLAQKLLETYHYPYLSMDHLKMGLIRSHETNLTVENDELLTPYLWNITKEIIKTAIENDQHLIVEGCYIPFDWKESFSSEYLEKIHYYCLIMTEDYINTHFSTIKETANIIEARLDDSYFTREVAIKENQNNLEQCQKESLPYLLIDERYELEIELPQE